MRSLLGAAAAFGAVSVLAKHAYESGSEPVSLLGVRLLVAALVLTALAPRPGRLHRERRELALAAFAGVAFAAAGLGEFLALSRASVPTVVVLVFVAPLWVALAGWALRGEPLGWARAAAIAGLLAGLSIFVVAPGAKAPDTATVALALGASVMAALFFMALEGLGRRLPQRLGATVAAWAAAATVVPLDTAGVAGELADPQAAAHGIAVGVLTAAALALLTSGVEAGSALTASAVISAEPVVAASLSWSLLGERPSAAQLAGGAVILLAVAALATLSARAPPEPSATRRTRRRPPGSRPRRRPARSARLRR